MPEIPAKCFKCGLVFRSGISVSNARGLQLSRNKQRCPRCGNFADLIDGTFDVGSGGHGPFRQTSGKPVDPAIFAHIGLILIQASEGKETPEAIIEKVAPHAPAVANQLRAVMDDPQAFATVLAALIAAFAAVAVAVIASPGNPPPPTSINVNVHTDGSYERERESFQRLQKTRPFMPSWTEEYLKPQKT